MFCSRLIHLHHLSSTTLTGGRIVGAHTTTTNFWDKTTDSAQSCVHGATADGSLQSPSKGFEKGPASGPWLRTRSWKINSGKRRGFHRQLGA